MKFVIYIVLTLSLVAKIPNFKEICLKMGEVEGYQVSECDGSNIKHPVLGNMTTAIKEYKKREK